MFKLNDEQAKRLSEHYSNLSLFFLGTALTPIFVPVEKRDPTIIILGLLLYFFCLAESLLLSKDATNTRS
jgi:hypothetical protein